MAVSTGATSNATVQLSDALRTIYSQEIRFASQPLLRYDQFAEKKEEIGRIPGNAIQFLKYSDLTRGGTLTEGTAMTKRSLGTSTVSITLSEYGNAVQISEHLRVVSFDDMMSSMSRVLGHDAAVVLDDAHATTVEGTSNVLYANGKTARADITAVDYFDTDLVKEAVVNLATNKAPKYNGNSYICFIHPKQGRRVRDDGAWQNASNYGAPDQLFLGEIGRYEDVTFIETTQVRYVDTTGNIFDDRGDTTSNAATYSSATNVYLSTIFGDNAWGQGIGLSIELRDDGVEDFGRNHSLAWYAIWGFARIENGHIYRLESAV